MQKLRKCRQVNTYILHVNQQYNITQQKHFQDVTCFVLMELVRKMQKNLEQFYKKRKRMTRPKIEIVFAVLYCVVDLH